MDGLIARHKNEYSSKPQVIASAPGILNLMGEHTDYNEGCVIQTTVNRRTSIAISSRKDNSLRFFLADSEEKKRTTVPNLKYKREDRWANYMKGVLFELVNMGYPIKGLDVTVVSDIIPGIGLGASAALSVAFTAAVNELYGFGLSDSQLIQAASYSESTFVGRNTEITDQFVSTIGRKDNAVFLDLRSLDFEYLPLDLDDNVIVIVNSNVPGTDAVREAELIERKEQCSECVEYLNKKKPGRSLRDYSVEDVSGGLGLLPEQIRRICNHVIGETQRSVDACDALKAKNFEVFGKMLNRSHESLRDNYEVSCPELDWLVKRSQEMDGVLGSRMTGGGFGGCTVTLLESRVLDNYRERLQEYEHIFGFEPEIFICEPSEGVKIVFPDH
ncbi:MAG: galactokinase [Spirochaetales bacterium]|uniref:Galactokinase n=1 Tax=Candidatus Thalassospirochaeta sargassi TaxID=3119039 RepID=A0AAJ1I9Q1_9SPIO|nr:galactokinase [Spirochaetales bacterium]